jgi:hypothetical protein
LVNRKRRWQKRSNAMADWAKQHNHDLEDRAIRAAGNHGSNASGRMNAEEVAELKALFDADY